MAKLTKDQQQQDQQEAREALLKFLKPGATVYTRCSYVAPSGMSRTIELFVPVVDDNGVPRIWSIGWLACQALGRPWDDKRQGIRMGGFGTDMGFEVVYRLGECLWPEGSDGGYALRQSWL